MFIRSTELIILKTREILAYLRSNFAKAELTTKFLIAFTSIFILLFTVFIVFEFAKTWFVSVFLILLLMLIIILYSMYNVFTALIGYLALLCVLLSLWGEGINIFQKK